MFLKVLHLIHYLLKYCRAVLGRITVFDETDFYILFQLITDALVVEPVGKSGLGINNLFDLLCKRFALIVSVFAIGSILKVMLVTQMDQDVIEGFFLKGQPHLTETFPIGIQSGENIQCLIGCILNNLA